MKCLNCNTELTAQDKFCPECGAQAPEDNVVEAIIAEAEENAMVAADVAAAPESIAAEDIAAAPEEPVDISSSSKPQEFFCAYCGTKIENGGRFCPDCGTPKGEMAPNVNLSAFASSAAPSAASQPENKGLAVASYLVYAIAALSLLLLIIFGIFFGLSITGINIHRPNNKVTIALPNTDTIPNLYPDLNLDENFGAGDTQTETSSQEPVTRPSTANHQPISSLTEETAQELVDIFSSYSMFGTCPSMTQEMDYEEGKRFLMANGFSADEAASCGVALMTECHSIAQVEEHIRLYVTDALASSCNPKWRMEADGKLYELRPGMGIPGYYYIEGSLLQKGNVWKAAFSMDYTDTITWATFVLENGSYKVSSMEEDPYATFTMDHPVYVNVTPQIAGELIDIYNDYALFGICPGDKTEISETEQERIFADLGIGAENATNFTVYRMNDCSTISLMQEHVLSFFTYDFFSTIDPPVFNNLLREFFCFEYEYDAYYATAHTGYSKIECDRTTLIAVGENKWEAEVYSLDHGDSYRGKATFVIENGFAKISSIEF